MIQKEEPNMIQDFLKEVERPKDHMKDMKDMKDHSKQLAWLKGATSNRVLIYLTGLALSE